MLRRTLDTLPPELVFLIYSYLSPVDASCLALCSHHFMAFSPGFDDILGKSFPGVRKRGPGKNLRIDFLTRLARHLPQYYLCYACLRLHLWRHIDLPTPNFKLRSCFNSIQEGSTLRMPAHICQYPSYSPNEFHFVHLHLAMRRFYFGPSFGISAESLTYTNVSISPLNSRKRSIARMSEKEKKKFWASHRTGLMSVEARVCPNPPGLCLRIQNLAVAKRQSVLQLCRENDAVRVCQHIKSFNFSHIIRSLTETCCRQNQEDIGRLLHQGKCDRCNTSWKLELREIEQKDICLLLTQWKDLGPGLDPKDDRWRTQQDWTRQRTLKASEMVDDPRMRFEMQSNEPGSSSSQALSEENMFLRNMSLLRGDRYRTVMTRWGQEWGRECWYLQEKEDKVKHS